MVSGRTVKARAFVLVAAVVISLCAGGCASTPRSAGGKKQELTGNYRKDLPRFHPQGRNAERENLYAAALMEASERRRLEINPNLPEEENLALEYERASAMAGGKRVSDERYGIVLGNLGLWEDALSALKRALNRARYRASAWGLVAVAQHALGHYKESLSSFESAEAIEPDYFSSREAQRQLRDAARAEASGV